MINIKKYLKLILFIVFPIFFISESHSLETLGGLPAVNVENNSEEDDCIGVEMPEGTEVVLEVSGKKFTSDLPNIPPCEYTIEEAENLVKEFMRETNVILFLKNTFEVTELINCEGKVIGTNVAQGASVSTGESLVFIVGTKDED